MTEERKSYPSKQKEYGVVLTALDQMRRAGRTEAKQVLYRLLDEAYRKGYEAGKKEHQGQQGVFNGGTFTNHNKEN